MATAQDIRDKSFEKAFNGYNMGQVDEFLDELAADFTAMAKENASLKGKLRVMVEKVEEYRETEDSMRLALLSAQKMSAQIESEARERADATIAEAKDYADRLTRQATDGIANEEAKLEEAKKATDKFFEHMRTVCEKQIEFYEKLSKMQLVGGDREPAEKAAPAPAPAPVPAPAPASAPKAAPKAAAPKPAPKAAARTESPARSASRAARAKEEETVRSIEASAAAAALEEPTNIAVDTDLPAEVEEPTRMFSTTEAAPKKKRRSTFDDFSFDDDI